MLSEPAGATVYVDGRAKGATPLEVEALSPGDHRIRIEKDGYLENSRLVSVAPGQSHSVQVKLTSDQGSRYAAASQVEQGGGGGGGGGKKALLIGLGVAAAGAGAYFAFHKSNKAPTVSAASANPTTALAAVTSVAFSVQASDPDGDSLTYTWNFGDGSTGTGASPTHVYPSAGSFNVSVTVSDGKASASGNTSVTVKSVSGTWSGNLAGFTGTFFTWNLARNGTTITGNYSDTVNGSGPASGSVSAPNNVLLRNMVPRFRVGNWSGTLDASLDHINGSVDWFSGGVRSFSLTRR